MRINVASSTAEVTTALTEFAAENVKKAELENILLQQELDNAATRNVKMQQKEASRKEIRDRTKGRMTVARDKLAKLKDAHYLHERKHENYAAKLNTGLRDYRAIQARISSNDGVRISVSESLGNGDLASKALILKSMEQHIDIGTPIVFENGKLKWRTNHIFIKDGFGCLLTTDFGKFDVCIQLNERHGLYEVWGNALPTEGTSNRRDNYPHPHLDQSGRICLGDATNRLLDAIRTKDFVDAVALITELLTTYNKDNPYVRLSAWELNAFDNSEYKCSCTSAPLNLPGPGHYEWDCPATAKCVSCKKRYLNGSEHIQNVLGFIGERNDMVKGICTRCKATALNYSAFFALEENRQAYYRSCDYCLLNTGWHLKERTDTLIDMKTRIIATREATQNG